MLKLLQRQLPGIWTNEQYSEQFNASPSCYKDFEHGILYVMKAAGKLLQMVEEADHSSKPESCFPQEDVEKYLADLVISTVRMALKSPAGIVDLENAVRARIETKMGVKL